MKMLWLGFFGLVASSAMATTSPSSELLEEEAEVLAGRAAKGYCICFGSDQFHDLLYISGIDGRRRFIYSYPSRAECYSAMARTYLCNF